MYIKYNITIKIDISAYFFLFTVDNIYSYWELNYEILRNTLFSIIYGIHTYTYMYVCVFVCVLMCVCVCYLSQ